MNEYKDVVIIGGSFNPPGRHHELIIRTIKSKSEKVVVVPCGPRPDKASANIISHCHKKELVNLAFGSIPGIDIDFEDLDSGIYTPTYCIDEKYEKLYPGWQIWHMVGSDLVENARKSDSDIQREWNYGRIIWNWLYWTVVYRPGYHVDAADMPPRSRLIEVPGLIGSGTMIRQLIAQDRPIGHLVAEEVQNYIRKNALYK
jgi:NAD+ kinase